MKKSLYFLGTAFVIFFAILIIKNPQICKVATSSGLILCSRVIIPSLYPFTFCVIFIVNSGFLNFFRFTDSFFKKSFGIPFNLFSVFLLSLIGGYPLGARLLNDAGVDKETCCIMLNFCVNAGPAFIITAVGTGVFGSIKIGLLLFIAHIMPSFLLLFLFKNRLKAQTYAPIPEINIMDNFVLSASTAASTLINICGYVLLFSVICAYTNSFAEKFPILKVVSMLLEVTNGVNITRNIPAISFLLGFGGICIWCQVFSISKNKRPDILQFALCRIFHGSISAILTFIAIKAFKITVPTISNGKLFSFSFFADTASVGISLIIMGIILMISLKNKNYAGNMLEDIV